MNLKKKKKGFTLIELMAVIAIIAILAAVLVPTVSGYINRSKKTAIITQVRNVVNAIETYNATASESIDTTEAVITISGTSGSEIGTLTKAGGPKTISDIKEYIGEDLLGNDSYNKLGTTITVGVLMAINSDEDAINNIQIHTNGSLKGYKYYVVNSTALK